MLYKKYKFNMKYRIEWQAKALRQPVKLKDRHTQQRITQAVRAFGEGKPCDVRRLVNHRYTHRLRVGDWRVLMTLHEQEIRIAYIEEVKKRDERTY